MKGINVLYAGMADDIILPFLQIPTLDKLYVICLWDGAFARYDWTSQKNDMKQTLLNGNNEKSFHREVYLKYHSDTPIFSLKGQSVILDETDDNNCWKLSFMYNGKCRELIYYHHRNFYHLWPNDIQNIKHLLSIGATFEYNEEPILKQMLRDRCTNNCLYYDQFMVNDSTHKIICMDRDICINKISELL